MFYTRVIKPEIGMILALNSGPKFNVKTYNTL